MVSPAGQVSRSSTWVSAHAPCAASIAVMAQANTTSFRIADLPGPFAWRELSRACVSRGASCNAARLSERYNGAHFLSSFGDRRRQRRRWNPESALRHDHFQMQIPGSVSDEAENGPGMTMFLRVMKQKWNQCLASLVGQVSTVRGLQANGNWAAGFPASVLSIHF